jgi:Cft2 family RNA processing exonuclease
MKIYSHEEIDLLIQSIEYKSYGEEFFLSGYKHISSEEIKITFTDAGHIIGSAGILIEHEENSIFYTGDINLNHQELLTGAVLPEKNINTIIIETTYGSTDSTLLNNWKDEKERFAKEINKILNNDGSILIPVFSLGKTQEVLAIIHDLMKRNKIVTTDIYTGGISRKISRIYDYNRFVVNYSDPELELMNLPQKNIYEAEDPNEFFKAPSIVLASSGMMLEKTISYQLGKLWLNKKDSAIFTVGYMHEETPGKIFAEAKKGDLIKMNSFSNPVQIKCSIKNFRFTAHSKREELIKIVEKSGAENNILIHGDPPSINWVGETILKTYKSKKVFAAVKGKEIIVN